MNRELLYKYPVVAEGYEKGWHQSEQYEKFDENYLFSDCMSLYLKGLNIFKYIYGDDWRRIVPIESLKEIQRVINKTLSK